MKKVESCDPNKLKEIYEAWMTLNNQATQVENRPFEIVNEKTGKVETYAFNTDHPAARLIHNLGCAIYETTDVSKIEDEKEQIDQLFIYQTRIWAVVNFIQDNADFLISKELVIPEEEGVLFSPLLFEIGATVKIRSWNIKFNDFLKELRKRLGFPETNSNRTIPRSSKPQF